MCIQRSFRPHLGCRQMNLFSFLFKHNFKSVGPPAFISSSGHRSRRQWKQYQKYSCILCVAGVDLTFGLFFGGKGGMIFWNDQSSSRKERHLHGICKVLSQRGGGSQAQPAHPFGGERPFGVGRKAAFGAAVGLRAVGSSRGKGQGPGAGDQGHCQRAL